MINENRVLNPNPYGSIEVEDIERFEKSLSGKLPNDYRAYLLAYNGGEFARSCIPSSDNPEDFYKISEMFSLYKGPEMSRLECQWDLSEYYDLQEFKNLTEKYLAFGTTGTGDVFLIKLGTGEVLIYLHNHSNHVPVEGFAGPIVQISSSFSKFVAQAVSNEERLKLAVKTDPEFLERLERIKKESGLWD